MKIIEFFSGFNFVEFSKATMVLFAVIDVIGSIPMILRIKEQAGELKPLQTGYVTFFIMIGFLILGESVLHLFGVNIQSFAVAGSILLFAMSAEMILGIHLFKDNAGGKTASIVPLAFPLLVGAGTMTTLISIRAEYQYINIVLAIFVNSIFIFLVLKASKKIENVLGESGISILKKVFGIILLALAVKLFTSNLSQLF
ncbi:MAG: MarC family protein [Flavobacteriia bacterium]|nr:MarC family protein [Flavobacteriia bacterium]